MRLDRRSLLRLAAAGGAASLTGSIRRALAIDAHNATGTIDDIEHIVVLMQENRSFDHYYGMLRGVRGFSDPRAALLPNGRPVYYQRNAQGTEIAPFHPQAAKLGSAFLQDLAHDWTSGHRAFNSGRYDAWVPAKGSTTMAHLTRDDMPFHYALADAFTVCDAYHCSILTSTDPNRYYMWTGWVGNDGSGGGPVVDNAEAGYGWPTYPERLEAAGVSWKIYQDIGLGLTAAQGWGDTSNAYIGNYGDNALLYFNTFRNATAGSPLHERALTGTRAASGDGLFDILAADVAAGTLPQVSWIVAPEAYSEHPNWPVNYGAWYISKVLDTLTSNPDLWSRTALIITYDENDGFFDHMVPPTAATAPAEGASDVPVANERFPGSASYAPGPYGLGVRVPCLVVSPWSRGGWVNSQLFDHTSIIRLIEARFGPHYSGLTEPNITPWRRAVAGDLTSAFDFTTPNTSLPALPPTAAYAPPDTGRHPSYKPTPPATASLPQQEHGVRHARPLPYALDVSATPLAGGGLRLGFVNRGRAAAVLQTRTLDGAAPRSFTVSPGGSLGDTYAGGKVDVQVHGPNGFYRRFTSTQGAPAASVSAIPDSSGTLTLTIANPAATGLAVWLHDNFADTDLLVRELAAGGSVSLTIDTTNAHGWYDLSLHGGPGTFSHTLGGHVETGAASISDPRLGQVSASGLRAAVARMDRTILQTL